MYLVPNETFEGLDPNQYHRVRYPIAQSGDLENLGNYSLPLYPP